MKTKEAAKLLGYTRKGILYRIGKNYIKAEKVPARGINKFRWEISQEEIERIVSK